MDEVLSDLARYLPSRTCTVLDSLSPEEALSLREIRLKTNCPLLLSAGTGRRVFHGVVHTKDDIDTTFRKLCASSAYSHRNEIRGGFVTLSGGHRVGIMGTAVLGEGGRVEGMRDVYGLCVRVARDVPFPPTGLMSRMRRNGRFVNLLVLGPPCSGKTTVLRSLARELSRDVQVSVIDEREELFPSYYSVPVGCDVLRGYPKAVGILQALRTLSPRIVVCDEVGTAAEVSAMGDGLRSGVSLLVSAHAYSIDEALQRPPVRELFLAGGIDLIAVLDGKRVGYVREIREREEILEQITSANGDFSGLCGGRDRVRSGVVLSQQGIDADDRSDPQASP